jgi:hypothetical protein
MIPSEAKDAIRGIRDQMNGAKDSMAVLTGVLNAYRSNMDNLASPLSVLEPILSDVSKYLHGHYHNDHGHQYCHDFNQYEEAYAPAGGVNVYPFMPPVMSCRKNKNSPPAGDPHLC